MTSSFAEQLAKLSERSAYIWNNSDEILERVKYAWIHADSAMAKVVGDLERKHIREVLEGQRKPTVFTLSLIARATNKTMDWLINGDEVADGLSEAHLEDDFGLPLDLDNPLEVCCCGHAARVHTQGAGNCLTFAEATQGESHCLEFTTCSHSGDETPSEEPQVVDHFFVGHPGSVICNHLGCDQPLENHASVPWQNLKHTFIPAGDGTCIACTFEMDYELHQSDTCESCGHSDKHDVPPIGLCSVRGCGCDGPMSGATRQEAWVKMVQLGQEMEIAAADAAAKKALSLCERCTGDVFTFPARIIGLAQRSVRPGLWAAFVHSDYAADELMIYVDPSIRESVTLSVNDEMVRIPLDTLEAVVDALRETGHRAVKGNPPR